MPEIIADSNNRNNGSIENIERTVEVINHRIGGTWYAFWRGMVSGFGYVVGAAIAVLIIGWVLNVVGVIPALKHQAEVWQSALQQNSKIPANK